MSSKLLIIGKDGQLGRTLMSQLGQRATGLGRADIDLFDRNWTAALDTHRPHISGIINAAAYTLVDQAEAEPDKAFRINAEAVSELARWCSMHNVPLVHISTDYVFDGHGHTPYREEDTPHPINVYGKSKRAGEQAVEQEGGSFLILRTSWLYSATGNNFFTTIRRLLVEKEQLNVVDDQVGAPTYTPHFAKTVVAALENALKMPQFPSGIYHLCSAGETSRYGFTQAIFDSEKKRGTPLSCSQLVPVTSEQYPTPARRPLNSRLNCSRARTVLDITMPSWEDGLQECFLEAL